LDNPAAEDNIMVVEDGRLSWTDGPLREVKSNAEGGGIEGHNRRGCCGCGIAKFDVDFGFALEESWIEEIEIGNRAVFLVEGFFWAKQDGVGRGVDLLDVQTLAGGNAEASALTGCVEGNAVVLAEVLPRFIDKGAGFLCCGMLVFDKGTIVPLSYETNLLALFELIRGET
jgi:hypothetical protein